MNTTFLLKFVMPAIFILLAASLMFIALKTLFQRRPLLFSSRWLFGYMCVVFLPNILNSINMGIYSKTIGMITWISPLMFAVMLVFFWFQMKGYMAFAISEKYFRDALLASTSVLGYTVEETMSRITIQETGQAIQVSIQGWTGSAQIKPVGKDSGDLVKKIANEMNVYFRTTPGAMNYIIPWFYLIMGFFMVAMSVWMLTLKLR